MLSATGTRGSLTMPHSIASHEGEVAHRPGEQRALGVAEPRRKNGVAERSATRCRPSLRCTASQAVDPEARGLAVLLGLLAVVPREGALLVSVAVPRAVAVVGLVVDGEDVAHAHEFRHDALEHLAVGFEGGDRRAPPLQKGASTPREHELLARLEGVVVGDDDAGLVQVVEHVAGHELPAGVVGVGVVGLQDAEAVLDRDARRHDKEPARESTAAGAADGVDRLPGDDHRHDRRLAGAGRQLEGEAGEAGVGLLVGGVEVVEEAAAVAAELGGDLAQPDDRLDGLDLAEEGAEAAELIAPPVLEQAGGLGRDPPVAGVAERAPAVDLAAELVDEERRFFVLLLGGGEALGVAHHERCLLPLRSALLRLGDRHDELREATITDDLVRRLARFELPVARRVLVGGVEDGAREKVVGHPGSPRQRSSPPRQDALPTGPTESD